MPWELRGKSPAGPYVSGSTDGRIRELEKQVEVLTDLVDALVAVIQIDEGGTRVRIVGSESLSLHSNREIELQGPKTRTKGISMRGRDLTR